ncbi:MAG: holo-[acyl-carrier-protein] synthase [Pseudomonadota bacterium]|jgi:holo-[acyl-carrier protein] synthase
MANSTGLRTGFDLVQISRIADSINQFGDRFKNRLFTETELDYANRGDGLGAERLAARFAAKEATIKALRLSNAGINWREIEVCKLPDGDCELALHGRVAELASEMGVAKISLSLSHDGDYAGAMVTMLCTPAGI